MRGPPGPPDGRGPEGRALPGGGGIGRPDGESGRPGGGGIGRPDGDIGRPGAPAGAPAGTGSGRGAWRATGASARAAGTSSGRCSPGTGRPDEIDAVARAGRGALTGRCRCRGRRARGLLAGRRRAGRAGRGSGRPLRHGGRRLGRRDRRGGRTLGGRRSRRRGRRRSGGSRRRQRRRAGGSAGAGARRAAQGPAPRRRVRAPALAAASRPAAALAARRPARERRGRGRLGGGRGRRSAGGRDRRSSAPRAPARRLGLLGGLGSAAFGPGPSARSVRRRAPPRFLAAAFFAGAFSTLGSSGCSSRVSPSRTARRRTMSEYASLSDDEWLFTGTPRTPQRSTTSWFVIPSSLASSCSRMFFATSSFNLSRRHVLIRARLGPWAELATQLGEGVRTDRPAPCPLERLAAHGELEASRPGMHSQAPRPGPERSTTARPSAVRTQRTRAACGRRWRQPTQVRSGTRASLVDRLALARRRLGVVGLRLGCTLHGITGSTGLVHGRGLAVGGRDLGLAGATTRRTRRPARSQPPPGRSTRPR